MRYAMGVVLALMLGASVGAVVTGNKAAAATCVEGNWQAQGFDAASAGAGLDSFQAIAEACKAAGVAVDRRAWMAGWRAGKALNGN